MFPVTELAKPPSLSPHSLSPLRSPLSSLFWRRLASENRYTWSYMLLSKRNTLSVTLMFSSRPQHIANTLLYIPISFIRLPHFPRHLPSLVTVNNEIIPPILTATPDHRTPNPSNQKPFFITGLEKQPIRSLFLWPVTTSATPVLFI